MHLCTEYGYGELPLRERYCHYTIYGHKSNSVMRLLRLEAVICQSKNVFYVFTDLSHT